MFLELELAQCTLLVFIFICNCHMKNSFYGLGMVTHCCVNVCLVYCARDGWGGEGGWVGFCL